MQFYTITHNRRLFYGQVQRIDENTTELLVGGAAMKCVSIHVYDDEDYVSLSELLYDSLCTLDDDLLPRHSGTIDLLNASLLFCQRLFPDKHTIRFTDESVIKCANGKILPLPEVSLMIYGQTWYQRHFDVKLFQDQKRFKAIQGVLAGKPALPWGILWSNYLSTGFQSSQESHLRDNYHTARNWHEFFSEISRDRCQHWYDWTLKLFALLSKNFNVRGTTWKMSFPKSQDDFTINQTEKMVKTLRPRYSGPRMFGGHTLY